VIGGRDPKWTRIEQAEVVAADTVNVTDPPGCTGEVRLTRRIAAPAVDASVRPINNTTSMASMYLILDSL
jgi:hypothetical protein